MLRKPGVHLEGLTVTDISRGAGRLTHPDVAGVVVMEVMVGAETSKSHQCFQMLPIPFLLFGGT